MPRSSIINVLFSLIPPTKPCAQPSWLLVLLSFSSPDHPHSAPTSPVMPWPFALLPWFDFFFQLVSLKSCFDRSSSSLIWRVFCDKKKLRVLDPFLAVWPWASDNLPEPWFPHLLNGNNNGCISIAVKINWEPMQYLYCSIWHIKSARKVKCSFVFFPLSKRSVFSWPLVWN